MKLVLLPGMDGTGNLFADFVKALPSEYEAEIARYPTDVFISYSDLIPIIGSSTPRSEPFVLVAESFSTPLAIRYAATNPPNLKGLVLYARFATSPVRGWRRFFGYLLLPILFRFPLPRFVVALLLVGSTAPRELTTAVKSAVSSVQRKVLMDRFRAVLECDARAELTKTTVPVLYVRAKDDRLVPKSCLGEIQRIKPLTFVAEIRGPHLILQREPTKTAEVVARFVRQIH